MNEFSYEQLGVGQTETFSRLVTAEMMDQFRAISGDINPLHNDDGFAQQFGYPSRVVYGMLSASMYSCLGGVYIPGKYCLLHSVHADFLRPVFVGDTLTVEGKLVEKRDLFRQIIIKAVIKNQDGKKISRAVIEAGVLELNDQKSQQRGEALWAMIFYCSVPRQRFALSLFGSMIGTLMIASWLSSIETILRSSSSKKIFPPT